MRLLAYLSRCFMAFFVWGWMGKTICHWYLSRLFKRNPALPLEKSSTENPTHWLGYFEMHRHKFYYAASDMLFAVSTNPVIAHRAVSFLKEHSCRKRFGWRVLRKTLLIYLQSFLEKHPDDYDYQFALPRIMDQLRNVKPLPTPPQKTPGKPYQMPALGGVDLRGIPQAHVNLFEAISEGRLADVKKALSEGVHPDIRNESLETPLMVAISNHRHDIAELLVESGADVNAMDRLEFTPLFRAVAGGQSQSAQMLLKAGANPNQKEGVYLNTPLMAAVSIDHEEIAKALIDAGADPWSESVFGQHAVSFAIGFHRMDILEYLLSKGLDLSHGGSRQVIPLHGAIGYECPEAVTLLITHGGDVNEMGPTGGTPLMHAARIESEELVRILLDAGADISLKDYEGRTALDWAATEEIRHLLEEKSQPLVAREKT